jgi:hypothetical protein
LWTRVQVEYHILDCGGVELLCLACQALDRAESLSEAIAEDGQTIRTRSGIRAHPALRDELANRALCARLLGKLGIASEPIKPPGRPEHWPRVDSASMTTNRRPISRPALTMISPRAIDLYESMLKLRCTCPPPPERSCPGCKRWYDLHAELHEELRCLPWEWPCVARASPEGAGSTCWNEDIAARMALLQETARRRTASSSLSLEEGGP